MCYDPVSLLLTAGLLLLIAFTIGRLIYSFVVVARLRRLEKFVADSIDEYVSTQMATPVSNPLDKALTIRVGPKSIRRPKP